MRCPFCGGPEDKVIDSRVSKDGREIRRRRECEACTRRFTTYERVEESMPLVIKRDGRREPFDRNKIERGLQFAVAKRQVSLDQVKATAEQIEREIEALGVAEIESRTIGERVLPKLRALDQVAFVRFASIYRDFRDLDELAEQIDALRAPPEPIAGEATGPTSAAGAGALGEPERTDEGAAYDDGTAAGGAA
ncbi:MAG: transcriptional repressor NrdR [Kofleriaceae bacterium]|jgi:transcriptional repressor NrdR|nr:transcriptional repressor NrdR [Kofleriaceae bacterium]MBP6838517.1 transcriptional repressor NrdR [Kofleriaceae bacterium]MBP9206817.1 transcriptional repressor NrdR [Kofleriaceae bacterium]